MNKLTTVAINEEVVVADLNSRAHRPQTLLRAFIVPLALTALITLCAGCLVGPKYQRASAPVTPTFKERPTDNPQELANWKTAQPSEGQIRGNWWEIYND